MKIVNQMKSIHLPNLYIYLYLKFLNTLSKCTHYKKKTIPLPSYGLGFCGVYINSSIMDEEARVKYVPYQIEGQIIPIQHHQIKFGISNSNFGVKFCLKLLSYTFSYNSLCFHLHNDEFT